MLSTIFKLYDIRGKYPSQINEVVIFDLIHKFPMVFSKKARVIIGHDARHSSPSLYKTAIKTLQELQYTVIEVGMITTPMLMFLADHFKFKKDIGIMITASHNPKDQNGIKIIDEHLQVVGGRDLLGRITHSFLGREEITPRIKKAPSRNKIAETRRAYIRFLEKFFKGGNKKRKLYVGVDCSNGSAGPILQKVKFPSYVQVILLNQKPDGNFPAHAPNPLLQSSVTDVKKAIKKHKADFGAVLDGDGDRIVFVDNTGKRVRPEYIWRLVVGHEKYKKTVVTELNGFLIKRLAENHQLKNVRVFPSRVGRKSFLEKMKARNADFGFENSGHYYFKDFFYSDCGILTLIKVLQAVRTLPYTLSDFIGFLPHTVRLPEYNIPARHATSALYHTLADMMEHKAEKISFFEGVSMYIGGIFVNVRASNTESEIRINVEGEDVKKTKTLLPRIVKLVKEMGKWRE